MPKWYFFGALIAPVLLVAGQSDGALTNPITQGSITAKLTPFVTIPGADGAPQDITVANDGTNRLFVATRNGKIDIVTPGLTPSSAGAIALTPFLNVANSGITINVDGEGGFPGLAFSPNFSTNGKFYTFDTENYPGSSPAADFSESEMLPSGTLTPNNQILIREWTVNSSNPNVANTTSRILMRINHPQSNHQGGSLKFGPDGDLYIGLGDGGGGNDFNGSKGSIDGHGNTAGNGQDTSVVFGKILRIDPNGTNSANHQYGIPSTNPFASGGGLGEIYTYGMRNPYRFSFDAVTGHLLVGDVGQDTREEVDDITAGGAGNYGWPFKEGTSTNSNWTTPQNFSSIAPIAEYQNSAANNGGGDAIIGGFVYRGSLMPQLDGKYIFGDLDGAAGGVGKIMYTDPAGGGQIFELKYDLTNGGASPTSINSQLFGFGEDANNELYAEFANGQVLRFVPEPASLSGLAMLMAFMRRRR